MASSYFLGSYVTGNNLNEFIEENNLLNINQNHPIIKQKDNSNKKTANASFHSFEEINENENSVIIKTNDESSNNCETKSDSCNNPNSL